jgi:long-chain fatty acid transport protein
LGIRQLAAVVAACALPGSAHAGGIVIPGAGPQPQARAGAFVAKADDPSTLAHNPAGFAKMDGTVVTVGANFVDYDLTFRRTGNYESTGIDGADYEGSAYPAVSDQSTPSFGIGDFQAVPSIAVSTDLGMPELPVRFGIGLFAPQGYPARTFPTQLSVDGASDPAPAPQRYDIIRQEARVVLPSIAVAYSPLDDLDIGARFSWGFGTTQGQKSVWSVRNYEEDPGAESVFTLDASDNFVPAWGLGLLYRPTDFLEIGANYRAKVEIRSKGTGNSEVGDGVIGGLMTVPVDDQYALCEPGGEIGALKACLDIDVPQMATVGGRYIVRDADGRERADVELDVRWEDWSSASITRIQVDGQVDSGGGFLPLNSTLNKHGFQDVFSIRLGGSYSFPVAGNHLIVRGGAAHDTATAPDSWLRVDIDGKARTTLATGLAFETSRFRVDVGGGVVLEGDVTVDQCLPPDGPTVDMPGCGPGGEEIPFAERDRPDPGQPLRGPQNQLESPFNAGTYESGYLLLSIGVTAWF